MKYIIFFLITFLAVPFYGVSATSASTCDSQGGECKGECSVMEDTKTADDCSTMVPKCCVPNTAASCSSQGGECKNTCSAMEDTKAASGCPPMSALCCVAISTSGESGGSGGGTTASKTVSLDNPISVEANPSQIIGLIIKSFLGVVGGLALVMMVWGGFQWLTSAGNPEKVKKGTHTMMWAIIGLILVLGSYVLVGKALGFLAGAGG